MSNIKVIVPDMPGPAEMIPYLREMHRTGVYCNNGPFCRQLAFRLQALQNIACVIPVANGTVALELALRALELPAGARVLVPAVTFVGSARAIVNAGLVPVICDVHPGSWQLTTAMAAARAPEFEAVMPVCAFGKTLDGYAWKAFAEDFGVPIVIDAAACLLTQPPVRHPNVITCFSLHGTKFVGAGEGGIVSTVNGSLAARVLDLAMFGEGGTNAKLSELHAAMALASMKSDRLSAKRKASSAVWAFYQRHLPMHLRMPSRIDDATILPVLFPSEAVAEEAEIALQNASVETKRWYAPFLHERPEFKGNCVGDLSVATVLARRLVGLPFHTGLSEEDVAYICRSLPL